MEPSPAVALHWKQLEIETPYLWLKDFEQYILSIPDPTNCEWRQNQQLEQSGELADFDKRLKEVNPGMNPL